MISLKELKTAINSVIEDNFPDIEIYANDIKEGFDRPSFFTDYDYSYRTDYDHCFKREISVTIYYFPSDRNEYKDELLEKQDLIESAIRKGFEVKGRHIDIKDQIESDIINKTLEVTFELEYYDSEEESGEVLPKMEELYYDGS